MAHILHDYLGILLFLLASIFLVRAIFTKPQTKLCLPPSPRALPIIGHLHLLGKIPHQAFHKLSNRYGPLIFLFFGSKACVVVSSPEMARECLKNKETSFLNRSKTSNFDYLTYGSSDFALAPYGPYWKFMKKLCITELLGGRILQQHLPIRNEEIKLFIQLIHKKSHLGEPVNVGHELARLANNIISRMTLRRKCSSKEDEGLEISRLVKEMCELAGKFDVGDMIWFCKNLDLHGYGKRLKSVRNKYDTMMEKIIKDHEEARKKKKDDYLTGGGDEGVKDLLDILLDFYEDEGCQIRLTRDNIKAFIMNMFRSGTNTSSVTIEWAIAELINHPNLMAKARQEIDSVIGHARIIEESDIPNLPYIQAILKETLRLHPTGPLIVRESTEDCTINGYDIPAKTWLFVNVWAINRDQNHWENPLEFQPERFLNEEGKSELDLRGQHFHLLTFGAGRRSCPGASLALQIVSTALAAMVQCFEWKVGGDNEENGTLNMEEGPGITLLRAHPLFCLPVARLHLFPET
ncbi:Cytochrome P450 family protein [Quillaja saponaria]|uniref:Cytochrome P450 family protein n=1 Tax=Quillaja saponaria TaxID=32244 RepID=A0AAD7PZX6_QUISA|nr:Cytochrome P450 family protein [Quillaja saponaria]